MKRVKCLFVSIILFFMFPVMCSCEENDFLSDYSEEYYDILSDELSEDALEILESSGFDEINFEKILSAEPKDIIDFFANSVKGTLESPLKNFIMNSAVLVLVGIAFSYLSEDEKKKKAVTLVIYAYIALSVCVPMASLLSAGAAAIRMSSKFMLVFLPILAGIIAAANNPLLALNYNSLTLYFAETVSSFSTNFLLPLEGMFFALVCISAVSDTMRIKNIAGLIKNTVTKVLSLLATIFVAVLSIKGILAGIADTVAVKGAKLLVSSIVPVIGGSMSEAYGAVVNSLLLLKSSVGIFGIAAIAAVNLPVITELWLWSLSMVFSSVIADVFSLGSIASFYRDVSDVIKTFNVILIFSCVLFIISTGILLTIKNTL
ncbi:MAG: hypothetical protein E7555_01025 [Ruminococcaceae bacterium]|nr:hypothetical protein [Oscillospiraceae bacterium]